MFARRAFWLSALLLASMGWAVSRVSASTPRRDEIGIPRVVGDGLPTAYERLHNAGLRVSIRSGIQLSPPRSPTPLVVQVSPRSGRQVGRGSIVSLTLGCPSCLLGSPAVPLHLPKYQVPGFVGRRVTAAYAWTAGKTLYFAVHLGPLIGGDARHLYDNYTITRQRPTPGTVLTLGRGTSSDGGSSGTFTPTPLTVWGTQARHPSRAK